MVRCVLLFYGRVWWTCVIIAFSTRSVTTDYFGCPKGWVQFLDKCYLFSKNRATWASSSYLCAEFGGTLAHLETKKESDFLENVVLNNAYVGCINDKPDRLLHGDFHYSRTMTNQMCLQKCRQNYYTFAGTQYYGQCFCGNITWNSVQNYGSSPENECRLPCYGDKQDWCGGHWKSSVYLTGGRKHWVGGTDMLAEEGWMWFPGNIPLTYTDWLPNEPDNELHWPFEKEHCMSLSPSTYGSYKWSDEICSELLHFICERTVIKRRHRWSQTPSRDNRYVGGGRVNAYH